MDREDRYKINKKKVSIRLNLLKCNLLLLAEHTVMIKATF